MNDNKDKLEAYYGLPREVIYCNKCVISNQRPASAVEFKHTRDSKKISMVLMKKVSVMLAEPLNKKIKLIGIIGN